MSLFACCSSFPGTFITPLAACCLFAAAAAGFASPNPNAVAIDSALARSTASTTTETKPYQPTVQPGTSVTLLYSASRGSKLEPCGCRSLNLGGIDREAAMIEAIRTVTPATVMVDAGGFFREFTDENLRLQTYHLLEALKLSGIQAMNIGYADLRQGLGNLLKLRDDLGLPFISSNIVNANTHQPIFEPYKLLTLKSSQGKDIRVAVLGVTVPNYGVGHPMDQPTSTGDAATPLTEEQLAQPAPTDIPEHQSMALRSKWSIAPVSFSPAMQQDDDDAEQTLPAGGAADTPKGGGKSPALEFASLPTTATAAMNYEMLDEAQAIRPLVQKLRPQVDLIILASYTSWERTQKTVAAVPGIDIAIAGEFLRHYDPENIGPSNTLVVSTDHDGKYLGQVDIALGADKKVAQTHADLIPILQSIEPDKKFTAFIDAYSRESEALPVPEGQKIAVKLYAGASSCRTCHSMEYAQWKTHPHSHAMKTLVTKGMQYNTDCLRCHTVAYKLPGGFSDIRVTPGLANVQCEVCHGPGQKHIEEMQKRAQGATAAAALSGTDADLPTSGSEHLRMQWDAKFCMQCHDPANDNNFHFAEDIQRVRHRNPAPARIRPTTATLDM